MSIFDTFPWFLDTFPRSLSSESEKSLTPRATAETTFELDIFWTLLVSEGDSKTCFNHALIIHYFP